MDSLQSMPAFSSPDLHQLNTGGIIPGRVRECAAKKKALEMIERLKITQGYQSQ